MEDLGCVRFDLLDALSERHKPGLGGPSVSGIPAANAFNWRISIGWWGIVALAAALPWITIRPDKDLQDYEKAKKESGLGAGASHPEASTHVPVWKWPIAWSLMFLFGFGFLSRFSITTHLESYLDPVSGHHYFSAAEVGSMLLVYNSLGLFHALIIPLVIGRMKYPYIIIALSGTLQIIRYLGLLYEPTLSWVWAVVLAPSWMVCTALFQLINLRTHTTTGASALSSFVQGVGYIFAGIGPLFVGLLHERTGRWTVPFWFLIVAAAVMMVVGAPSVKHEYLEDAVAVRVKHPPGSTAKTPNIG
jgi:CP family cyanate transporter-like MFS transporter